MKILLIFVCMLTTAGIYAEPLPEAAGTAEWKFSSSVNYDTGKYGTPDRTDSVYIPFTLKHYYRDAELSVTVPYLRQSSKGQVTWVGGKPVGTAKKNGAVATAAEASAESGLGDIAVRGTYTLKREGPRSFDLAVAGRLKLPTANRSKGLGTGEMDEGVGLEFAKEITPRWSLLADGYFTIIGDPDGVDFNNQVSLDIGFYRPLRENLGLTVLYETQSAIADGNADPRSVSGTLSYSAPEGVQFSGGLTLGLSDGSPDIGVSAGFSRKF
ncbi:MAG: transporter [Elusimicrobiota bacterium]|nr:transporter [Elusimicrobiota bacterium]